MESVCLERGQAWHRHRLGSKDQDFSPSQGSIFYSSELCTENELPVTEGHQAGLANHLAEIFHHILVPKGDWTLCVGALPTL